jgi:asparagine synthase (glutamine-hydrolysing)
MYDPGSETWLVFNGEIYNFRQLRTELKTLGAEFSTSGDTEVLHQALIHWGEAALGRLEGMFAFAFWDARKRALLLARDPLGIKPLYYRQEASSFAFASEVKVLETAGLGPLTLDHHAVALFLTYGAVVGPRTIYGEIRELTPGHLLRVVDQMAATESRYWSLDSGLSEATAKREQDFETGVYLVRERLVRAVESHLVSDVPVGVFLSGGVDSSLLALLAARRARNPITLLTVAFAEEEFSELPYAREIAHGLPHRHEVVTLSAERLNELLPEALMAMDQPTVDGINTYVISRVGASLGLKVLVSGVGGDELFGGYTTFRKAPQLFRYRRSLRPAAHILARSWTKNPIQWKKIVDAGPVHSLAEAYLVQRCIRLSRETLRQTSAVLGSQIESLPNEFQKVAGLELQFYMCNQLLRDADVFSMANSVELRVPFLDLQLLQAALNISPDHHFEGGRGKRITRRILGDLIGEPPLQRKKRGFSFPWKQWLRGELRDTINTTFRDKRLFEAVALDPAYGRRLLDGLDSDDRLQSWSEVWSLFVLLNWQRRTGVECAAA